MSSFLDRGNFFVAALIPVALGLACSKHNGLDRGDANGSVLNRSATDDVRTRGPSEPSTKSPHFARAPEDGEEGIASDGADTPAPPAVPASPNIATQYPRSNGTASAAPGSPTKTSAETTAELRARGGDAFAPSTRSASPYKPKEERPGLGTSWGETRKSWVSSVSFEREDPNAPFATTRIYYNDAQGILTQTGERSLSSFDRNLTELARGFVTVEIVDPDGLPLPGLVTGGRSYVVGRDGDRYSIRIRNQERFRVEVVATVDGLDVIDGTIGSFEKRGYVVEPYSSLVIEGFRKSKNAVAAFRFGAVSDSYAARTGSDRNVGVIGVAFFPERGCCDEPYSRRELDRRESADPFPGQFARPPHPRRSQWSE